MESVWQEVRYKPNHVTKMMTITEFIDHYREAFGAAVPLPVAFGYSHTPATAVKKVPRCMIGAISKVREGESLTLSAENVTCGGGGLYTAFAPMPDRVPAFVSETEHYKQTKEMVVDYVESLEIRITDKPYLNFVRIDCLETWDGIEGLLFFATPDMLSGLCSWAFFDNNAPDAVCTRFASGCGSIVAMAVQANRQGARSCFIGMLDPSARLLVPRDELTFVIPASRLPEMLQTMTDSALYCKAYSLVRRRLNGEI